MLLSSAFAEVRMNPYTGYLEGNICANLYSWGYVQFQPVGSFCAFLLPNGMMTQGQIINR